jgi:nitrogen regulatory protein P-II 1
MHDRGVYTDGTSAHGMKRVEAIFSPVHLEDVVDRLRMIGIHGITLHQLRTQRAEPHPMTYRGVQVDSDLEPAVRIDVVTPDDQAISIINAVLLVVQRAARPEGFIYVTPIDEVIRIRTGQTGEDAL